MSDSEPGPDPFDDLKSATEELEERTPQLGNAIEVDENRLRELAPRIEVWLTEAPLSRQDLSVSESTVAAHVEDQLGYALDPRPGRKEWCLCLRRAEFAERPFKDQEVLVRVIQVKRLVDTPQEQQLAALGRIPDLVRAIAAAVRARSGQIGDAGGPAEN